MRKYEKRPFGKVNEIAQRSYGSGQSEPSASSGSVRPVIIEEPEIKSASIREVMEAPFPIVDSHLTVGQLSSKLGKDTKALLVRDEKGDFQIITRSDLLVAVAR